jgi:hypothetical protein
MALLTLQLFPTPHFPDFRQEKECGHFVVAFKISSGILKDIKTAHYKK